MGRHLPGPMSRRPGVALWDTGVTIAALRRRNYALAPALPRGVSGKMTVGVPAVAQRDHVPCDPTLARSRESPPGRREREGAGGTVTGSFRRKAPQALSAESDVLRGRGKAAGCCNTCTVSGMARGLRDHVGHHPDNDMWDTRGGTAALRGKSPVPASQSADNAQHGQ